MRRGVRAPQHTCGRRVGVAGEEAVEERVEARLHRIRDLRAHADAPQGASAARSAEGEDLPSDLDRPKFRLPILPTLVG